MKYLTSDLSFMRMCAYVFLVCVCLCFAQEASAYGYSQGSYSYSQGSYYSQSSYSYSYSQGSYTYSQGSYSYSQSSYSYSYSQGSYTYSQGSYSSSYSQGSYSSGYYSQGSYSSKVDPIGNGTTWQEVQNFSKPSTCTGLCAGAKAVTSAASAVGSTVKESADWLVSAGSKFLGAAKKAAGIETPAYTQLPDSSTNPRGDVAEKPTVTTPTKTFEDIKEAEEERKIQAQGGTTVIAPGLNALQQKTLDTAKAAGLNVSNKAVEAVVLLSLEKNGNDPTKAVTALTKIQEETGADLNRAISTNIALGSSLCGNSQCEAADKIREIIDVDQTELAQKMASIDKIKNPVVTTTQPAATTPTKTFQDIKDAEEERIIKAQQGTETTKPVATTPTKSDPVGTSPTWAELQEFNKPADTPNPTFQDIKDAEEERKIAAQGGTAPAKPAATAPAYDPFAPGGEATQAVLDSNKAGAEKVVSNLIGFVGGLFGAKPAPVPPADIPTVAVDQQPTVTSPAAQTKTAQEIRDQKDADSAPDAAKPVVKPVTVTQKQVDLTGMFGDTLSTAFYPGTTQKDLVDTELITPVEFKDVKVAVFQPKDEVKPVRVVSVPAKSVKTISLYDTAKIEENPSTSSFVDDDTYTSSNLKSNAFTEVKDDLKAILPTGQEIYAEHEGFPVMSPGELALVGKLDLTRGGLYDEKEELAALELALRGEIPADVRERINNGTATEEDLIELAGIITVLVNRSISRGTSIETQVERPLQVTSVTWVDPKTGKTFAEQIGFQPKLLETVQNLMNGTHSKEFGLSNIEPDELAYAAEYYSPAGILAGNKRDNIVSNDNKSTPNGWDVDFTQPNYRSAGGHIFGNVLQNGSQTQHGYSVAGKELGLDLGLDESTQIITTSLQTMPVRNVQSYTITPTGNNIPVGGTTPAQQALTPEERIKQNYIDYAAGRNAARDALAASAETTAKNIAESEKCPGCVAVVKSRGAAAGVDEFYVEFTPPGSAPANPLNAEQQKMLELGKAYGFDASDPTHQAAIALLQEAMVKKAQSGDADAATVATEAQRLQSFKETLELIKKNNFSVPEIISNLAAGKDRLIDPAEDGIRAAMQMDAATAAKTLQDKANAITAALNAPATPAEPVIFDINKHQAYLDVTPEALKTAQTEAMNKKYAEYVPASNGTGPAVKTADEGSNCGFICNSVVSAFGGIEGARSVLTKLTQTQTSVNLSTPLSDAAARERLDAAGIKIVASEGGTTDLEGIREGTVLEVLELQRQCGCEVVITGGTEDGHADGTFSHENGYKIDLRTLDGGSANDLANYVTTNFELDRTRGDGAKVYIDPKKPNVEYAMEGNHLDISVVSEDTTVIVTSTGPANPIAQSALDLFNKTFPPKAADPVSDTQPATDTDTPPQGTITTDKKLGETVSGIVKGIGDAITGFIDSFTGKIDNTKPAESLVSSDSDNDSDPEPTSTPTPKSALDLTVKATAPTKSTNTEYRFKGELSRILSGSEDEYLTELQKNFSVNIENRLNIDFSCNGTVDTQKIFTLPYRSFSTQGTASTLFMSEYLEVTRTGSHCFYFDIDIKKVITESNEGNNQSNKFNFTVGE